jgi:hypothetical protein
MHFFGDVFCEAPTCKELMACRVNTFACSDQVDVKNKADHCMLPSLGVSICDSSRWGVVDWKEGNYKNMWRVVCHNDTRNCTHGGRREGQKDIHSLGPNLAYDKI